MSISFVKSAKKTNIRHNNRDLKENEYNQKAHRHIQRNLSEHNIYIKRENIQDVYEKLFGDAVKEYNSRQTRSDRQIKNYYQYVKKQKNLEVQREFILSLGDYKDWEYMGFEQKLVGAEALQEAVSEFIKNNPRLYVYNAVVHVDEVGAPHAHINAIPMATGYKQGMLVRPSFDKALENQGISEKGKHKFEKWRNTQVKTFEQVFKDYGVSRKLVGTNAIKDMNEYKEVIAEIKIQKDKLELYKEEVETAKYLIRSRQKIESDIDFYHSRLNDIKLETEVSELWLEKYNTKLDVLKGHLATLERSVEDWSKKAEKSENDALKLLKTANDIKTDNKKLEIKNIELKKEYENLSKKIQETKNKLSEKEIQDYVLEIENITNETVDKTVDDAIDEVISDFERSVGHDRLINSNKRLDLDFAEEITNLSVTQLALEYLKLQQYKENVSDFVNNCFKKVTSVFSKDVRYEISEEQYNKLNELFDKKYVIKEHQQSAYNNFIARKNKERETKTGSFYDRLNKAREKTRSRVKEKSLSKAEKFFEKNTGREI